MVRENSEKVSAHMRDMEMAHMCASSKYMLYRIEPGWFVKILKKSVLGACAM